METKFWKTLSLVLVVSCLGLLLHPAAHAEYNNITHTDVTSTKVSTLVAPSGTFTFTFMPKKSDNPATGLSRMFSHSALFSAAGTSPSYTVEVLCSMDGVTFTKPEVGGDLGTFTGTTNKFVPINTPLSPGGHQIRFTETGGVNSVTWTCTEAGQ
jgi:hypothetical protein